MKNKISQEGFDQLKKDFMDVLKEIYEKTEVAETYERLVKKEFNENEEKLQHISEFLDMLMKKLLTIKFLICIPEYTDEGLFEFGRCVESLAQFQEDMFPDYEEK